MTALMHAAVHRSFGAVNLLVKAKAGLNKKSIGNLFYGEVSALMLLLGPMSLFEGQREGRFSAFRELVNAGADVNVKDNDGRTMLMRLLDNTPGPEELITWLINDKRDNDKRDNDSPTGLLAAGIKPNLESKKQWTALMYAAWRLHTSKQHVDALQALIQAKADLDVKNENGKTALMLLLDSKKLNEENLHTRYKAFTELVKAGADVNIEDNDGNTVLMLLLSKTEEPEGLISFLRNYRFDDNSNNSTGLLAAGVKPDIQNTQNWTALMYAVSEGYVDAFMALVEAGADFNLKNDADQTALMLLMISERDESYQMMGWLVRSYTSLQPGKTMDVNKIDKVTGSTALMLGADNCRMPYCLPEYFEGSRFFLLLNWSGVEHDLNAKNEKNQTVLMIASESGALQEFKATMKKIYPAGKVGAEDLDTELRPAACLALSGLNKVLKAAKEKKNASERPQKRARVDNKEAVFREILHDLLRLQGLAEEAANIWIEEGLNNLNNKEAICGALGAIAFSASSSAVRDV